MLDIRWIRDNRDALDEALDQRGVAPESAAILALDEARRAHVARVQEAQARRNAASRQIGAAMGAGDTEKAEALKAEVGEIKTFLAAAEGTERDLDAKLRDALSRLPNIPLDDVPVGEDEAANVEVRQFGEKRHFDFDPKEHFELGEALGQMDFERAAKMSGARFTVVSGGLARLERALGQFMLDVHTQEHGYTEVNPPLLVRDDALFGTGQLPKFEEDLFRANYLDKDRVYAAASSAASSQHETVSRQAVNYGKQLQAQGIPEDEAIRRSFEQYKKKMLDAWASGYFDAVDDETSRRTNWLIPTAEVPLTNLVREEILDAETLPLRFTALTPCFRSEAGSAGRDTRGYLRQHQFYKVELVSITDEDSSIAELDRMTKCAETILERLGLHFRTMVLSTGDMGFAARKTFDVEVWLPGQGAYREISSCSVCGDFQGRRMHARYRAEGEKQTRFVHTLNGSGVALGRALIAVMETYQQADGSIAVPDVLKPYMGGLEIIEPSR